jgi:hypothetical protein
MTADFDGFDNRAQSSLKHQAISVAEIVLIIAVSQERRKVTAFPISLEAK